MCNSHNCAHTYNFWNVPYLKYHIRNQCESCMVWYQCCSHFVDLWLFGKAKSSATHNICLSQSHISDCYSCCILLEEKTKYYFQKYLCMARKLRILQDNMTFAVLERLLIKLFVFGNLFENHLYYNDIKDTSEC